MVDGMVTSLLSVSVVDQLTLGLISNFTVVNLTHSLALDT